ncbi:HAMP domain-containing histidine kinase [Opitutaceae bacterium]|nr:HAMP domain-containing histidine kinase [Opitutaceae bacterium]
MNTFIFRTTAWFALLATVTIGTVLAAGGWLLNRQMIAGLELLHEVESRELAELLGDDPGISDEEVRRRLEHDADYDADLFLIQIHDAIGRIRFRSENLGDNILPDLSGVDLHRTITLPMEGLVRVSETNGLNWHIQIASKLEPNQRILTEYIEIAGLLILVGVLISVVLGWIFSRLTLAPIRAIAETAGRIGGDNLGARIEVPPGRDELVALTRLLNETFDRIETAFSQVRHFTADASHELKTPLALIRLNAEKLHTRLEHDEESANSLGEILEEIDRLHQILEHLLFLSKADSGVLQVEQETLSFPAWLEEWSGDARVLVEDGGRHLDFKVEGEGPVRGVSSLLRQVLFNLLTNAIKFSPAGGRILVQIERRADAWRWIIEDEGPGLPESELSRVFDRFVRYESRESAAPKPGHGLGLAICRSIIELHRGRVYAENRGDRSGLRVVVDLPLDSGS